MISKHVRIALLAVTVATGLGGAALASGVDPAFETKLRAKLTDQGYDVRRIETEDGQIEVYALKDGKQMKFFVDDKMNILGAADSTKAEN